MRELLVDEVEVVLGVGTAGAHAIKEAGFNWDSGTGEALGGIAGAIVGGLYGGSIGGFVGALGNFLGPELVYQ